jgi:pimeloyl-ACP methyl ester carboxylesterase/DNA-binding SARP family transcriptional activator
MNETLLHFQLLGEIKVFSGDEELIIPPSRKTRALLGYLLLSGVPQRRERLCELFWDVPDDPRGALRWSLSKLRGVVGDHDAAFLQTDRERVALDIANVTTDVDQISRSVDAEVASIEVLEDGWKACQQILLQDCDLPSLSTFTAWLVRERNAIQRLRIRLARRLAAMPDLAVEEVVRWADAWLDDAPFEPAAAVGAVVARFGAGRRRDAEALRDELTARFVEAGLQAPDWPVGAPQQAARPETPMASAADTDRAHRVSQRVRFAQGKDGASLAWASVGDEAGPPLVKAANWLSHLELDWEAPIWSPLFRDLAQHRRLIRYDERGCGLSDWDVPELSFETFVTDLETVVDAAGLEQFPLLGISQGASVCIEYAARHPERVSHLILFGGYAAGWRHVASPEEVREREAVMVLTEAGWGRDNSAYRHLFTSSFLPGATDEELSWFDDFQRRTTSPKNAVRFLDAFSTIDVRHRLAELRVPTLVLHSRGDMRIPLSTGRQLAAAIPGAEFVGLDSTNHLLLGREPASTAFLSAVRRFLAR